ncbi:hypothetical protein ISCGN_018273 [Ixodes scapularis]
MLCHISKLNQHFQLKPNIVITFSVWCSACGGLSDSIKILTTVFDALQEVTGCKKALIVLGLATLEPREQYCTRHGEQDRFQRLSRHYSYFDHGWTTRTRGSSASRSSTEVGTTFSAVPAL